MIDGKLTIIKHNTEFINVSAPCPTLLSFYIPHHILKAPHKNTTSICFPMFKIISHFATGRLFKDFDQAVGAYSDRMLTWPLDA